MTTMAPKTITVGELRQNPTAMLDDVERGLTYRITRHGHEVGRVVPPEPEPLLVPPKKPGGSRTSSLSRIEPADGRTLDDILAEIKGPH